MRYDEAVFRDRDFADESPSVCPPSRWSSAATTPRDGRHRQRSTRACFHGQSRFNFTDAVTYLNSPADLKFHDTGLYDTGGTGAYPPNHRGLLESTAVASDMGRFTVPPLRNVAKTGPYMHDGSTATLKEVIEHDAAGGRPIEGGPNAGVDHDNPFKSGFVMGFDDPADDKAALVAFLESLTDDSFLTDPKLSNPWP